MFSDLDLIARSPGYGTIPRYRPVHPGRDSGRNGHRGWALLLLLPLLLAIWL